MNLARVCLLQGLKVKNSQNLSLLLVQRTNSLTFFDLWSLFAVINSEQTQVTSLRKICLSWKIFRNLGY